MLSTMDPLVIAILCILLAGALAVVDLLVPSGGILAVLSLLAAVVSVYFGFRSGYTSGMVVLTVILVAIPVFLAVALRIWPHTPIGRRLILKAPEAHEVAVDPTLVQLQELVGQVGVTQNSLMPCGMVRIQRRNYNAMCDCGIIEAGQNVEVISVQQRNLVVAPTTLSPARSLGQPMPDREPSVAKESLLDRPAEELGLDSLE